MASPTKQRDPRVVLSFQQFGKGASPLNLIVTADCDPEMDPHKAFEFAVNKMREEKFSIPPKHHEHD